MTKILYDIEDHFDALATARQGTPAAWISRILSLLFGFAGDIVRDATAALSAASPDLDLDLAH